MNPVLEKLDSLPVELQAIINSDEIVDIIDTVCEESEIPYSWRGELIRAVIRVLSGLLPPKEFVPFIMDEYFLEREGALILASKLNEKIFSAVKPQLASLYNIEDKQIAKKLQVPKKPKIEEPPVQERRVDQTPYGLSFEPAKVENLMPKVVPNINIVHPSILKEAQPISPIMNDDIVPRPPHHVPSNDDIVPLPPVHSTSLYGSKQEQKPLDSNLANKLGNLRTDQYRESI